MAGRYCISSVVMVICVTSSMSFTKVSECPKEHVAYNEAAARCSSLLYHCIKSSEDTLIEGCLSDFQWIEKGKCPVLHVSSEQFEEMNCQEIKGCPKESFKSFEVYKYPICLGYLETTSQISTTAMDYTKETTAAFTTSKSHIENKQSKKEELKSAWQVNVTALVCGIMIPSCMFGILISFLFWCDKRQKRGYPLQIENIISTTATINDADTPIHTNKLIDENEENLKAPFLKNHDDENIISTTATTNVADTPIHTNNLIDEDEENSKAPILKNHDDENIISTTATINDADTPIHSNNLTDKGEENSKAPLLKNDDDGGDKDEKTEIDAIPTAEDNDLIRKIDNKEISNGQPLSSKENDGTAKDTEETTASPSLSGNSNHEGNDIVQEKTENMRL